MKNKTIESWVRGVIIGPAGLNTKEAYELLVFGGKNGERIAVAEFVIRALANPECEGSREVLQAIINRRAKTEHETFTPQPETK